MEPNKQSVASRNETHRTNDVLKLAHEAVTKITVLDLEKYRKYRNRDIVIDKHMKSLIW